MLVASTDVHTLHTKGMVNAIYATVLHVMMMMVKKIICSQDKHPEMSLHVPVAELNILLCFS